MAVLRFLGFYAALGVLAAAVSTLVAWAFGWSEDIVTPVVIMVLVALGGYVGRRKKLPQSDWPDPEISHKMTALLLVGLCLFVAGAVLLFTFDDWIWTPTALLIAGLIIAIPGAIYHQKQEASGDPRQDDERAQAIRARATHWGWVAMLQVALIGGLVDLLELVALSGAQVGFAAGVAGIAVSLGVMTVLDWRDAQ